MVGGGEVRTNTEEGEEVGEEGRHESASSIRDDVGLKTVEGDDVVEVHSSEIRRLESVLLVRDANDGLGESIDEDLDAVESI